MRTHTTASTPSHAAPANAWWRALATLRPARLAGVAAIGLISGCSLMPWTGGPDWQQLGGTVALSDNATLKNGVMHLEIRDSDEGGEPLAVTQQPVDGKWPSHFELQYDANGLDQSHHYVLEGHLSINGKLTYMEQKPLPVLGHGAASNNVQLVLVPRKQQ